MWSKAIDRQQAIEAITAGFGTPQNIMPHPDTPYAADDSYRYRDVQLDVAGAKALLAKMGYTDTDGDGFVNRLDGTGNLELYAEAYNIWVYPFYPFVELAQSDMAKIGLKLNIAEGGSSGFTSSPQTQYFYPFTSSEGVNPWGGGNIRVMPIYPYTGWPQVGQYFKTRGEAGMAPTGPDPMWTDIRRQRHVSRGHRRWRHCDSAAVRRRSDAQAVGSPTRRVGQGHFPDECRPHVQA